MQPRLRNGRINNRTQPYSQKRHADLPYAAFDLEIDLQKGEKIVPMSLREHIWKKMINFAF
jgi:hypothetical protein